TTDRLAIAKIEGGYRLDLKRAPNPPGSMDDLSGVLAFRGPDGERRAVEIRAPIGSGSRASFLKMILFALAGGLLLNLMPCVFPLISLKVLGLIEQTKKDHSKIRTHWLVF